MNYKDYYVHTDNSNNVITIKKALKKLKKRKVNPAI